MGQDIKDRISKRKVAAEADMSSNDPTASSIPDEARQLEMEKNLEELAILRNGEEIGEKDAHSYRACNHHGDDLVWHRAGRKSLDWKNYASARFCWVCS